MLEYIGFFVQAVHEIMQTKIALFLVGALAIMNLKSGTDKSGN